MCYAVLTSVLLRRKIIRRIVCTAVAIPTWEYWPRLITIAAVLCWFLICVIVTANSGMNRQK